MASRDYHFVTHWKVPGTIERVSDILAAPLELPRWWPEVYIDVEQLKPGDPTGVGAQYQLLTRGFLPYRLRWSFEVTESRRPHGFSLRAWGDIEGAGIWTFEQLEDGVLINYDWRVRANKPIIHLFSPLLKPLFSANHAWAMRRGREALLRELGRDQ